MYVAVFFSSSCWRWGVLRALGERRLDSQASPHRDHHAREPLVRCVFWDVSRSGRHSDEQRRPHGLRSRARRRLRSAFPRSRKTSIGVARTARMRRLPTWMAERWMVSCGPRRVSGAAYAAIPMRPTAAARPRSWDTMTARASQLLDVCARFRAPRPALRAECIVEFTAASLHGLGVVGVVQADRQPHESHQRAGIADFPPDSVPETRRSGGPARAGPPMLGRPDLSVTRAHVSWAYYVMRGNEPDCANDQEDCGPVQQKQHAGHLEPAAFFDTVKTDGELGNIRDLRDFYAAAANGTLPERRMDHTVGVVQRHPPGLVSRGQAYVTGLINALMRSPDWKSTAIFLAGTIGAASRPRRAAARRRERYGFASLEL